MAPEPDPYRTLELASGASIAEVRRAYRRLAKIHHPDAAGERALPRFLAIQAAYEQLIGGTGPATGRRRTSSTPPRPSQADPDRTDATHRAYGGRARGTPGGSSAQPGASGAPPGASGAQPGATDPAGSTSSRAGGAGAGRGEGDGTAGESSQGGRSWSGRTRDAGRGSAGSGRRRRAEPRDGTGHRPDDPSPGVRNGPPSKATLGSTSYDGADSTPFEPDWGGASWYGTTSGTYWTLNPKEYADPRKHGPEYQARALRATRASRSRGTGAGSASARAADPAAGSASAGPTADPTAGPTADPVADATAGPTHTTSSWWDSTAGAPDSYPDTERTARPTAGSTGEAGSAAGARPTAGSAAGRPTARTGAARPAPAATPGPPPDIERAAADLGQALTDEMAGGLRGRLVRAIVGWLPLAFGIGWLVGELTGCGRFAATCDGMADPFVLLIQAAVLAGLVLVPAVASIAAAASIALFLAAIGAALILSASGGAAGGGSRESALGAVLVAGWLIGAAIALVRRARAPSAPTRPVS